MALGILSPECHPPRGAKYGQYQRDYGQVTGQVTDQVKKEFHRVSPVFQANSTPAFPRSSGQRRVQTNGSTVRTMNNQLSTPTTHNAEAMAAAQ